MRHRRLLLPFRHRCACAPTSACAHVCRPLRLRPCHDAQHEIYAIVRNAMEIIESCGLERELRREAVRKLRANGGSDPQVIAAFEDGWLVTDAAWVRCAGDAAKLATRVKADEEGRVKEVELGGLLRGRDMKELPASVGRLQALQKLDLAFCEGLTSLPSELGGLQALTRLNLDGCNGLTSLPDLSGLEKLEYVYLPEALKPWKEQGRKAFALPTEA